MSSLLLFLSFATSIGCASKSTTPEVPSVVQGDATSSPVVEKDQPGESSVDKLIAAFFASFQTNDEEKLRALMLTPDIFLDVLQCESADLMPPREELEKEFQRDMEQHLGELQSFQQFKRTVKLVNIEEVDYDVWKKGEKNGGCVAKQDLESIEVKANIVVSSPEKDPEDNAAKFIVFGSEGRYYIVKVR